jgi:hypothetical protein
MVFSCLLGLMAVLAQKTADAVKAPCCSRWHEKKTSGSSGESGYEIFKKTYRVSHHEINAAEWQD